MIDTRCGLSCENYKFKEPYNCGGCIKTNGVPFHGKCSLAECCQNRGFSYCGECPEIPCKLLNDYSCDSEHGDKPKGARIEKCITLSRFGDLAEVFVHGIDDFSNLNVSNGLVFDNGIPYRDERGVLVGFNFSDYFQKLKKWGFDVENYFKGFTPIEITKDKNLYLFVDENGVFTAKIYKNGRFIENADLSSTDETVFNLYCFVESIKYMRKREYDKGQTQEEIKVYLVNTIGCVGEDYIEKIREILKTLKELNCRITVIY